MRAQDEAHQRWLGELLDPWLVDDPHVAPNYSVRLSEGDRSFGLLYWGGCLVARCRTTDELVRALDGHLGGHHPVASSHVRLRGVVLRGDTDAVVLTHADQTFATRVSGRLRDQGVAAEPRAWIDVHAESHRLSDRPSIGLQPVERGPVVRALVMPGPIAGLSVADRAMALQRSGQVVIPASGFSTALHFLRRIPTESAADGSPSRVAESIRTFFRTPG